MPRYTTTTEKNHTSNSLPYPSVGLFSRIKGLFAKEKPVVASTVTTPPTPAPPTSAPSTVAPPDISTISNLSTRNPNDTLSEFFTRKGDEPLNEIEVEGVLSLIRKAQSQSRSASANHSLLASFDAGNNTTTILRRASSHLPKPVTVPTPTFKSRVRTQTTTRSTSTSASASASFSAAGVSKRRIISYNSLDSPYNIKHRGLKSFIERKKKEVEDRECIRKPIYNGGKIDLNFEDTAEHPLPTQNKTPHISSTANSVLSVLNELEQSKEEKKQKEEKERLEKERQMKEKQEKERLEKERLEKERLEKERLERERLERERLENERLEKEKVERQRKEQEEDKKEEEKQSKVHWEKEQQKLKEEGKVSSELPFKLNGDAKDTIMENTSTKAPTASFIFKNEGADSYPFRKDDSTTTVEVIDSFVFPQVSPAKSTYTQPLTQVQTSSNTSLPPLAQPSTPTFDFPGVTPISPALLQQIASLKDSYKDVFTF